MHASTTTAIYTADRPRSYFTIMSANARHALHPLTAQSCNRLTHLVGVEWCNHNALGCQALGDLKAAVTPGRRYGLWHV